VPRKQIPVLHSALTSPPAYIPFSYNEIQYPEPVFPYPTIPRYVLARHEISACVCPVDRADISARGRHGLPVSWEDGRTDG
jgi:hypothetical protein